VNNAEQQPPPIKNIANLIYRWVDVPMPLVYQVPMPIISELFALGLVALVGDQKNTFAWVGEVARRNAIAQKHLEQKEVEEAAKKSFMNWNWLSKHVQGDDDPIVEVVRALINSAESIKFEQTKGSRQQYEKITQTLYTTIEITNHGPTSEHPKPLEG